MTSDESTWLWWLLLWGTEGAKFNRHTGTASHLTDAPEPWENANQDVQSHPTGGINHQNTCGHGFTWRESFYFTELPQKGPRGRMLPPARAPIDGGSSVNKTLLGASPAEVAFRDYHNRKRRWSSE